MLAYTSVNLVITGTGFQDGASVIVDPFVGFIDTEFLSPTTLQATLPDTISPGTYTVNVRINEVTLSSPISLTVLEPPATAEPTATATPTLIPATRPLIVVDTYSASEERILPGTEFNLVGPP